MRQRAREPAPRTSAAAGKARATAGLTDDEVAQYNRAVAAANEGQPKEAWADFAPIATRLAAVKKPADPALWRQAAALALNLGALSTA